MKHTHIRGIEIGNSGLALSKRIEIEAEQGITLDPLVPASATNKAYDLEVDVSAIKSIFAVADQALTLKTNSSGAPVNTIELAAGQPFFWGAGIDGTLKDTAGTAITTDITKLYVTNPADAAVKLNLFILIDPTA